MRLIKPSFEIIEQEPEYEGMLRHIEWVGRHCYKSLDKITEDSAEKFVNMLVNRGHTAMVEHGTVYLKFTVEMSLPSMIISDERVAFYDNNKYSEVVIESSELPDIWLQAIGMVGEEGTGKHVSITKDVYITTNYRVLLQNDRLDDLQYQCEPTEHHVKRVTVKFILDRGISHEFVRHRVFSFAQESTRYCNYIKSKFGSSVTFITPPWLREDEELEFEEDIQVIENLYFKWLNKGWTAQQARGFLCNFLKTELIMTGTIEQWEGFFKLRCAKDAHPQARELAQPLHEEFKRLKYVN